MHFSSVNASKTAVNDAYCNPSIDMGDRQTIIKSVGVQTLNGGSIIRVRVFCDSTMCKSLLSSGGSEKRL